MKNKYNPFKMWGSYVGLIIASLYYIYIIISNKAVFYTNTYSNNLSFCWQTADSIPCIKPFAYIAIPIIFFLIGWGIHSLFRRLK